MDEFISLRLNGKPTSCLEDLRKFSVKELQDLNTFSVKELQDLRTFSVKELQDLRTFSVKELRDLWKFSVKELQDLRKFSVKELLFVFSNQSYGPDSFMDHANCCIYVVHCFYLENCQMQFGKVIEKYQILTSFNYLIN